jgi:hypothetical protein
MLRNFETGSKQTITRKANQLKTEGDQMITKSNAPLNDILASGGGERWF